MNEAEIIILDYIREHISGKTGDIIMPIITYLGNAGILWIVLAITLIIIPRTRRIGVVMTAALVMESVVCNLILKLLVARTRPFDVNTAIELIIRKPRDYSFPSGHTAASFASAAALFFEKTKLWIPAAVIASLIAFSRLYLYVHYPTDVLAGMVLGIITGFLASRFVKKHSELTDRS